MKYALEEWAGYWSNYTARTRERATQEVAGFLNLLHKAWFASQPYNKSGEAKRSTMFTSLFFVFRL
jgi:hypothetical protein